MSRHAYCYAFILQYAVWISGEQLQDCVSWCVYLAVDVFFDIIIIV